MPIPEQDIVEGGYYLTPGNQLRRVDRISADDRGRRRVRFVAKSDNILHEAFGPGSTVTIDSQPFVDTFAGNVDHRLSEAEIADRRNRGVLLASE